MGQQKFYRPQLGDSYGMVPNAKSSTNSATATTLKPYGFDHLSSTSTVGAILWTLALPIPGGRMHKYIEVKAVGATSANHHITLPSSDTTYDGTNDLVTLNAAGDFIQLQSESTSRWHIRAMGSTVGVILSTST
jgi:hypothetical protein